MIATDNRDDENITSNIIEYFIYDAVSSTLKTNLFIFFVFCYFIHFLWYFLWLLFWLESNLWNNLLGYTCRGLYCIQNNFKDNDNVWRKKIKINGTYTSKMARNQEPTYFLLQKTKRKTTKMKCKCSVM